MAVVKGDAYGHGSVQVARTALANGATSLAVATLSEAEILREAGIMAPILLLGYTPAWQMREVLLLDVMPTVFDIEVVQVLSDVAQALEHTAKIHVKVDTGMGRLGLQPQDVGSFLYQLTQLHNLHVEGLYTHFAAADSLDKKFTHLQLQRFKQVLMEITAAGIRPPLIHAANSAALLGFPEAHFDMVRPGIACYGLDPSPQTRLPTDFRPALSFNTEVAQVKEVPQGVSLSYTDAYITRRPSRIATIPVGYADGFRRSPPWHMVVIHGCRAPLVGRVTMDYALIDVTDVGDVERGDPVVLIGAQGEEQISAEEVAVWLQTNVYEIVTAISGRVPRVFEGQSGSGFHSLRATECAGPDC